MIAAPVADGAELQAGAAVMDITPPVGMPMWGYASRRDAPSKGVRDRLKARAVVLCAGNTSIAIVSLDLGRPPTRQSFRRIQAALKKKSKVRTLFLTASHTHHGPVVELDDSPGKNKPYTAALEKKLIVAILAAERKLQPARFGVGAKEITLNRNRHSRLPNPPVDRQLLVMRLESTQGKPIAHLVNFAAHPTMLPSRFYEYSADYPGELARRVEKATAAPCLFLQGAAGDLSANPGKAKGPKEFGAMLSRQVLALDRGCRCAAGKNTSLKVRQREFCFKSRFDLSNPLIKTIFSLAFFPKLVNFYEREYREGVRPKLTVALLDKRIGFVGVSGEFFCGHALHLKTRAGLDHLFFLGYCNDYQQYFPTIEAVAEGGYGADPEVAPVEVGAGERMMDRALIDLYQMRGRIKKLRGK